jgi:hypothetical protein
MSTEQVHSAKGKGKRVNFLSYFTIVCCRLDITPSCKKERICIVSVNVRCFKSHGH